MRNKISGLLAGAVLALGPGPVSAEADGPDFYRVTGVPSGDVLNIRAEPKASAARVG